MWTVIHRERTLKKKKEDIRLRLSERARVIVPTTSTEQERPARAGLLQAPFYIKLKLSRFRKFPFANIGRCFLFQAFGRNSMSNACLSCSCPGPSSSRLTGPDGFRTLCKPCSESYRDCRLRLHMSPSGVSVQPSAGSTPARHLGFKSRQFFSTQDDFLSPIVEARPVVKNLSGCPFAEDVSSGSAEACVACGNDNSNLYPGPDGQTTLCATCYKRLSDCKLRLWRSSSGIITAKPTPGYEKVVAIGFNNNNKRRNLTQPQVRTAKKREHESLPSHRPRKLQRGADREKRGTRERSKEPGWEPTLDTAGRAREENQEAVVKAEKHLEIVLHSDKEADDDSGSRDESIDNDEDDDDLVENESDAAKELGLEVRQLKLRGRVVPISGLNNLPTSPSSRPRRLRKAVSEINGQSTEHVTTAESAIDGSGQLQKSSSQGDRNRGRPAGEAFVSTSRQAQGTSGNANTRRASGLRTHRIIHSPFSPSLLKSGPFIEALRSRAMSFGVKASCTYGWQTQRRFVSVAYGLRFLSFKQVLCEIFDMDGVPFTVCYVDDDGDEIGISEDSDMRPMFDLAKGKQGALRVRLRPP